MEFAGELNVRFVIVLSLIINMVLFAQDTAVDNSLKYRLQRYFRWLKGTATKQERDLAAQTIMSDGAKTIAMSAVIGGCMYYAIYWIERQYWRPSMEHEFWTKLNNLGTKAEQELPNIDMPQVSLTARVNIYDTNKKNLVFLIADKNVSLNDLPILCKTIQKMQERNMFDAIQIHRMFNQNYDMVFYKLQKKNGIWSAKKYKKNETLSRVETENG
jgi:hypothetical protein